MAATSFIIQELDRPDGLPGERFEWTPGGRKDGVDSQSGAGKIGVRAAPRAPWEMPGRMRLTRTDYNGGVSPTIQVLGPANMPQKFEGRWDDRHNYTGFAQEERERFVAMCRRGNVVRIEHGPDSIVGIISDWRVNKARKTYYVDYMFTLEVIDFEEDYNPDRVTSLDTTKSPRDHFNEVDVYNTARAEAAKVIPHQNLDQTAIDDTDEFGEKLDASVSRAELTVSQQEIVADTNENGLTPFKRLATQFKGMQTAANNLVDKFDSFRSDSTMIYRTALSVLNFEDWFRSTTFHCRLMMSSSAKAAKTMEARDEPDAKRLHITTDKEHLYAISQKYYGTFHDWDLIYERNGLSSFEVEAGVTLIIPEKGQG